MASSSKKLIVSTLLTGTAVATGTLLYGVVGNQQENLIILDDSIPPVLNSGLLPPPATFRMTTPPPKEIPGIRRLKIVRPSLSTDSVLANTASSLLAAASTAVNTQGTADTDTVTATVADASGEDYYLTGTRSADLIRTPVEARIETFPTVTLDEAVEGALAVDEWGFQVVQAYLNQAMGDTDVLKDRMDAMLERIELAAADYDLTTISDAANLIIEAGARTHWAAFMAPFVLDENFELTEGAMGWDLGPQTEKPFTDFERVSSDSKMLVGRNMQSEGAPEGPSILSKGVRNIEEFTANGLKNGKYKVVILTAPRPNGQSPLYPFGVDMKRNGGKVNMVDTRATDDVVPVMKLSREGVGRLSDGASVSNGATQLASSETMFELSASAGTSLIISDSSTSGIDGAATSAMFEAATFSADSYIPSVAPMAQAFGDGDSLPATGHMLVTRAEVVDGTLRLNFRQLGGQDTYVTAVIIYPEAGDDIEQILAEEVVEFVQEVAPKAGQNITVDQILGLDQLDLPIVDPVTVFEDASVGLPTIEGTAATPLPEAEPIGEPPAEEVAEETTATADSGDNTQNEPANPAEEPVTGEPPAATPPAGDDSGVGNIIGGPPPDTTPPETTPPETTPPETTPPETSPPETSPPETSPPETTPPETTPPETTPPETSPPETSPPETSPPETSPPETSPPETSPPETSPPDTAPEPQPQLAAEAGVYDVIPLGESFTLDGCGSTFQSEAFCSLVDSGAFTLTWLIDGNEIGTGQRLLVNTGENTDFTSAGTLGVELSVRYDGSVGNNQTINFLTGGSLFLPGDFILTSVDTALVRIVTSVPEPSALLLLAPSLAFVAGRQRRRRKKASEE